MRYRARANGNILDTVPESLIGVLYDPIEEDGEVEAPERISALRSPEAPLATVAHTGPPARSTKVEPMSTQSAKAPVTPEPSPAAKKPRPKRRRG